MKKELLHYRTQYYIPWRFVWGLPLIFGSLLLLLLGHPVIGASFLLLAILILTTHYGLEIDLRNKSYREYTWVLGARNGETRRFAEIQYVFIKKIKVSQTINSQVNSTTIRKDQFEGYIKFSEDEKIHLRSEEKKEDLLSNVRKVSADLGVKIIDYTAGTPIEL